jgi:hypothetical protein
MSTAKISFARLTIYPDQPTETADAAMAYSSTSAQPTIHAIISPKVA